MRTTHLLRVMLFTLLAVSIQAPLQAEQSKSFGDYVIHYNAFNTEMLQPEVAKQYGIKRSKNRVMYNITVLKKDDGPMGKPVEAEVSGHASNLNDQMKQLRPRKVVEGNAIYYIGDLPVTNQETLDFEFEVKPEGAKSPYHISFRRQFFTN